MVLFAYFSFASFFVFLPSLSSSQEQQKQVEDPSREVKKVRKARNRRQEWNVMAYDKEFRPDARFTPSPYHGMSSEGSLSPDNRYRHGNLPFSSHRVC